MDSTPTADKSRSWREVVPAAVLEAYGNAAEFERMGAGCPPAASESEKIHWAVERMEKEGYFKSHPVLAPDLQLHPAPFDCQVGEFLDRDAFEPWAHETGPICFDPPMPVDQDALSVPFVPRECPKHWTFISADYYLNGKRLRLWKRIS